jgi:hypothetical protein
VGGPEAKFPEENRELVKAGKNDSSQKLQLRLRDPIGSPEDDTLDQCTSTSQFASACVELGGQYRRKEHS